MLSCACSAPWVSPKHSSQMLARFHGLEAFLVHTWYVSIITLISVCNYSQPLVCIVFTPMGPITSGSKTFQQQPVSVLNTDLLSFYVIIPRPKPTQYSQCLRWCNESKDDLKCQGELYSHGNTMPWYRWDLRTCKLGICRDPGAGAPWILKDDCVYLWVDYLTLSALKADELLRSRIRAFSLGLYSDIVLGIHKTFSIIHAFKRFLSHLRFGPMFPVFPHDEFLAASVLSRAFECSEQWRPTAWSNM